MLIKESDIRRIIRRRLIEVEEKQSASPEEATGTVDTEKQGAAEIAGDLLKATAAGGVVAYGIPMIATAATSTAMTATGLQLAGATLAASGPPAWPIAAGLAVGLGIAAIVLDESETDKFVADVIAGDYYERTQKYLSDMEAALKAEGVDLPFSLKHVNLDRAAIQQAIKQLWSATKGGALGLGLGTDEAAIKDTIETIPSIMDVALVAREFKNKHGKSLSKVFEEELGDGTGISGFFATGNDMYTYVTEPIKAKIDSNVEGQGIFGFETEKGVIYYDKTDIENWVKEAKEGVKKVKEGEDTEGATDKIDPNALSGNSVKKIQIIMNMYAKNRGVEGAPQISEDGNWGPKTDELWGKYFCPHVFKNHAILSKDDYAAIALAGKTNWKNEISPALSDDYPGYTGNTQGALAFVADAYNGDTSFGKNPGGLKGGAGGGKKRAGGDEGIIAAKGAGGASPDLTVSVRNAGGATKLEEIGFPGGTSDKLATALKGKMKEKAKEGYEGSTINIMIVVNKSGRVITVSKAKGQRRGIGGKLMSIFERMPGTIKRNLAAYGDVVALDKIASRKKIRRGAGQFELEIEVPAGKY